MSSQMPCAQHKKPAQDIHSKHDAQLRINIHSGFLVPAAPCICDAVPPKLQPQSFTQGVSHGQPP